MDEQGTTGRCLWGAAAGHVWTSQAGDYYEICDDLPRAEGSSGGRFLAC